MSVETHEATAAAFQTPGGQRLRDLVNTDQEASAAMYAFVLDCLAELRVCEREYDATRLLLPAQMDRRDREQAFADLVRRMVDSSDGDDRERMIGAAQALFEAGQMRVRRRQLLRRLHRVYLSDMSDHAAADVIALDLARRFGVTIISTGNKSRDALIDEALLCCARPGMMKSIPSARSIRRELAPG